MTKNKQGSFDWSQCKSERGSKNCALCDLAGGGLPCSHIKEPADPTHKWHGCKSGLYADCPDGKIWETGRYFSMREGKGECIPVSYSLQKQKKKCPRKGSMIRGALNADITVKWASVHTGLPGGMTAANASVAAKALVKPLAHSESVAYTGLFMFKRMTLHTGKNGTFVGDTYKIAWCIRCKTKKPIFEKHWLITDDQKRNFMDNCFRRAFIRKGKLAGQIQEDWQCSAKDLTLAKREVALF